MNHVDQTWAHSALSQDSKKGHEYLGVPDSVVVRIRFGLSGSGSDVGKSVEDYRRSGWSKATPRVDLEHCYQIITR